MAGLAEEVLEEKDPDGPLWPAEYAVLTAECAYRWLTECWWTLNEADGRTALIPKKEYIRWLCEEWVSAYSSKTPLVIEKSRRIVVSWCARGLETWAMGLRRGEWLIVDQTHSNAGEHLWRVDFALNELYARRPELNLRKHETRGSVVTKEPTHVLLPNGSIITQGHQEAGSAQGKGKTGITLEELSKYRAPSAFWSQAKIVTMGEATSSGGWICGICNSSPNPDWHKIKGADDNGKGGVLARELLGFE